MSEKSNCLLAESHLKTHMDASIYPVVKNLRSVADELDDVRKEIKKQESNHKFDRLERFIEGALDDGLEGINGNLTKGFSSTKHKLHDLKELTQEVGVNVTDGLASSVTVMQVSLNELQNNITQQISALANQLSFLQSVVNAIACSGLVEANIDGLECP